MKKENETAAELQVITVGKTTFPVEVRNGRLAVNLTAMAKPYGKLSKDWFSTESTQRYLQVISVRTKILTADLVEVRQGGSPQLQGTWVYDRRIAVRFAQWVDEELAIDVDTLLVDVLEGRKIILNTTPFEDRRFVSLEDFCAVYKLSPNAFYSYKAHYPYEYIWTGGSWRMSTRLCHYIELRHQLNHNKQSMYQYKIDIDKQQGTLDFKSWED